MGGCGRGARGVRTGLRGARHRRTRESPRPWGLHPAGKAVYNTLQLCFSFVNSSTESFRKTLLLTRPRRFCTRSRLSQQNGKSNASGASIKKEGGAGGGRVVWPNFAVGIGQQPQQPSFRVREEPPEKLVSPIDSPELYRHKRNAKLRMFPLCF